MNTIIALVGMPGSGKSEVSRIFESHGFVRIRFGDITDEQVAKRGLPLNEENERVVREQLRQELGMAAYAILNRPRIDDTRSKSPVILDGLYSWEEYIYLKDCYGDDLKVIAVWSAPETRYARLAKRVVRPLTHEEASSRDRAEIENLNKGGPIALAEFTIINEMTLEILAEQANDILKNLGIA